MERNQRDGRTSRWQPLRWPVGAAPAAAQVQPYGTNDFGGFRNVLPPGQGRNATLPEIIQNQAVGGPAAELREPAPDVRATSSTTCRRLSASNIDQYFKDGSFGVKPARRRAGVPTPRGPA